MKTSARAALSLLLCLAVAGCTSRPAPPPPRTSFPALDSPSVSATPIDMGNPRIIGPPGTEPPPWLGRRPLPLRADGFGEVRPTPRSLRTRRFTLGTDVPGVAGRGFRFRIQELPPGILRESTWTPGCPVRPEELSYVRVKFWGFDGIPHGGELIVNSTAAQDIVGVFGRLYRARFPIEQLRITRASELDAPPTGDGNNTGSFVCRTAVGQTRFSEHAYGLAIDINPFQNPYVRDDLVLPELASAYLDRTRRAPGMIHPDGVVVRAFAAIGWEWGGAWNTLKDYQHFSASGR